MREGGIDFNNGCSCASAGMPARWTIEWPDGRVRADQRARDLPRAEGLVRVGDEEVMQAIALPKRRAGGPAIAHARREQERVDEG